jgi:hypothetical protein
VTGTQLSHGIIIIIIIKENFETIPKKHSLDSLKKTAIFGTSHTIRNGLQSETGTLSGRDRYRFKRSTRKKSH